MRHYYFATAVLVSSILVGCGGGGTSDLPAKPKFTGLVSFGDSLMDVGTYKVGLVATLGGGQYTINAASGVATNWTELIAPQLGLPAPCPAQTGLDDGTAASSAPTSTSVLSVYYSSCTSYAQGGARVTNARGISSKTDPVQPWAQLTVPVVTQISNHHTAHGNFTGDEIVFVMAGGNDVFAQLEDWNVGAIGAQVTYDITNGICTPIDAQASNCVAAAKVALAAGTAAQALAYLTANAPVRVDNMKTAATDLSGYVQTLLSYGAKHVVVVNMPDIGSTPYINGSDPGTQGLVKQMVSSFNSTLANGVAGNASVLYVDAYTANHDQVLNPGKYLLTNVTTPACNLALVNKTSLLCNATTSLNTGVTIDSHYLFADGNHPTPYGHTLISMLVLQAMTNKGWY